MIPPTPRNRRVAPIRSGATAWTLRPKKSRWRRAVIDGVSRQIRRQCWQAARFRAALDSRRRSTLASRMRIFLAGAAGAIGARLLPLLTKTGHTVTGTTRSPARAATIEATGAAAVLVDAFDVAALERAVRMASPVLVIHQLPDLPREPDPVMIASSRARNARLRIEGTRNLVSAVRAAAVHRIIAQSLATAYAPRSGAAW